MFFSRQKLCKTKLTARSQATEHFHVWSGTPAARLDWVSQIEAKYVVFCKEGRINKSNAGKLTAERVTHKIWQSAFNSWSIHREG